MGGIHCSLYTFPTASWRHPHHIISICTVGWIVQPPPLSSASNPWGNQEAHQWRQKCGRNVMEPQEVLHEVFQPSWSTSLKLEYSAVNSTESPMQMMTSLKAGVENSLAPGALSGARMMQRRRNAGPGLRILSAKVDHQWGNHNDQQANPGLGSYKVVPGIWIQSLHWFRFWRTRGPVDRPAYAPHLGNYNLAINSRLWYI